MTDAPADDPAPAGPASAGPPTVGIAPSGPASPEKERAPEDARLRAVAEACDWVMRFPCRTAPGLVFVGARSVPAEVWGDPALEGLVGGHAGGGETPEAAFAACMGEAAEFLCQFEQPGDLLAPGDAAPADDGLDGWTPPDADRVRAVRRPDGAACALPAARVLRRPGQAPPFRLSTGCAAGASPQAARLAALLEGIERDAAALWWRGGRPARALDLADPALADAAARIAGWREGAEAPRTAWALHLEAAGDVPVAAMLSTDPEGRDLSIGVAARPTLAEALLAAAREAVQGELSLDLIAERRAVHGEGVLGPADRDRLALAALDPARTARLFPRLPPVKNKQPEGEFTGGQAETFSKIAAGSADSATIFNALVELLSVRQHTCRDVDLTRSRFGLPVFFAVASGLQPFPAAHVTPRLARAMQTLRARGADGREAEIGAGPDAPLF